MVGAQPTGRNPIGYMCQPNCSMLPISKPISRPPQHIVDIRHDTFEVSPPIHPKFTDLLLSPSHILSNSPSTPCQWCLRSVFTVPWGFYLTGRYCMVSTEIN
ncbi:hypothetical protein PLICRDRAFT_45846 [Plicaturopsis crispa FD-325 SS-3]|uniref:Uncharacterized protein n=1 Tax=Plicaturopsis crispa FD-325 SS-3 TaxID=944288 RepID=A0A0C9SL74_PLICR|nr:hypothetical protein PLICRDRAFT_45846 [Plicaturopsis crispa FD-325 SS-3]